MAKIIPMCGGHDYAVKVNKHAVPRYYFVTSEGISTHPTREHIDLCLNGRGFGGCLDIGCRALPTAKSILEEDNLPDYFIEYLQNKIESWG